MYTIGSPFTLRRLHSEAILPKFGTPHSACFDISACLKNTFVEYYTHKNDKGAVGVDASGTLLMHPHYRYMIPTGWAIAAPRGFSLRLYSRSGLALKQGIVLVNSVGVVDEDYRHQVFAVMMNTSGCASYIEHGDRICQGEFVPQYTFSGFDMQDYTDDAWFNTSRQGGFGSTGVK